MTRRSGSADLPLHGGRVPMWLAERMSRLGAVITQAIVHHYGRDEFLRRLAHPFWFQSFGAVMGMDWHSSGITTSVMGALKRGLEPLSGELGLHVCGGRGRHSRKTPDELHGIADMTGLDGDALARASRLVAKVDSAAVQDSFDLYLHSFVLADDGQWVVIQQGMNGESRYARRYHWQSEGLDVRGQLVLHHGEAGIMWDERGCRGIKFGGRLRLKRGLRFYPQGAVDLSEVLHQNEFRRFRTVDNALSRWSIAEI